MAMAGASMLNSLDELIEFLGSPQNAAKTKKNETEAPTELMQGKEDSQFGLICFNCLCRGNVASDRNDCYRHIKDESLIDWDLGRREVLMKQLLGFQSELICVQEVECNDFDDYLGTDMRKGGYEYVLQNNPHISEAQRSRGNMGCAIFYRPEVFEQVGDVISRSRSVLASFKHIVTDSIVHVLTCHLQGDPKRVKDRFGQMKSNFKYLRKLIKANGEGAVIVAGDFNTGRDGAPYKLISTGTITASFREFGQEVVKKTYKSDFVFKDAYEGSEETPTFFNPFISCGLVDFIFFRGNLQLVKTKELYSESQFAELVKVSLPNSWNGSDHVPIGCVLEFS